MGIKNNTELQRAGSFYLIFLQNFRYEKVKLFSINNEY
jgi:hypothetical protein